MSRPLWTLGFEDARWLLPEKSPQTKRVALLTLGEMTRRKNASEQPEEQRSTALGAWSRTIPLYLAESIWFNLDAEGDVYLPVAKGVGPAVFGYAFDQESVQEFLKSRDAKDERQRVDLLISGTEQIDWGGFRSHVELTVWEGTTGAPVGTVTASSLTQSPGQLVQQLERQLLAQLEHLGLPRQGVSSTWVRPEPAETEAYLLALDQLLAQMLVDHDLADINGLWGEDRMYEWYLTLADHMTGAVAPKLMFLRAMAAGAGYGSQYVTQFEPVALKLLNHKETGSEPWYRLSPLLLKRLGKEPEAQARKAELLSVAAGDYRAWLEKL